MGPAGRGLGDAAVEVPEGTGDVGEIRQAPMDLDAFELVVDLVANRLAMSAWLSPRMLTTNRPASRIARPVSLVRFMQTSSIGGSMDSDETALAVVPRSVPSAAS